jgi:hypothetical protein
MALFFGGLITVPSILSYIMGFFLLLPVILAFSSVRKYTDNEIIKPGEGGPWKGCISS